MTKGSLFSACLLLMCQFIFAQRDSIALLEVTVSDVPLQLFSTTQQSMRLNDSIIAISNGSLTSILQNNTPIYFKENGFGMVSSASFRGTTAQQTAVVWNGININSQLNGQTDFNTINIGNFDSILVRSGGGSAIYGSSAIGGSIHLNSDLRFGKRCENEFAMTVGSFETYRERYKLSASNDRFSLSTGITRSDSRNNYDYIDSKPSMRNANGQFYNSTFDVAAGYKINSIHVLKLYSQLYEGERYFSGTLASIGKSKYDEINTRNLFEWQSFYNKVTTTLKLAAWSEQYRYFADADHAFFTTAQTESSMARYEVLFPIGKLLANALIEHRRTQGHGSDIEQQDRNVSAAALMFRYRFSEMLEAEGSLRKEITHNYDSPLLFSAGMRWQASNWYAVKWNVSRNFRIPTFNDLYWSGSGNPDLNPERSFQGEIGQEFTAGLLKLSATAYYTDIREMLRWVPGKNGVWSPQNVASVTAYGVETALDLRKQYGPAQWHISATYNYSLSEDEAIGNQLTYTPFHIGTASVAYQYKKWGVFYQWRYNGKVFTSTDHAYKLVSYQLSNAGVDVHLAKHNQFKLGVAVMNLFEEVYQSTAARPMPGRNYNINLTFKF